MTPLQQFRIWLRRSPKGERASAAVAAALASALLVWIFIPASSADDEATTVLSERAAAGATPADRVPSAATDSGARAAVDAPTTVGRSQSPSEPVAGSPQQAGQGATEETGCSSPPGGDQGVTDKQITIGIMLSEIVGPAGNSAFGVPGAPEQQQDYEQVIDAVNASGGVACRTLVAKFITVNGLDQSDQQQKCLSAGQANVLAVIDAGAYYVPPGAKDCFAVQAKLPYLGTGLLTAAQKEKYFPYLFSTQPVYETLYRNTALGLAAQGFFDTGKGFAKLGIVWRDCAPELNASLVRSLHDAGVPDSKVVTYSVGCPDAFANPGDMQQAILKFQQNGVTHMTYSQFGTDFGNFTLQSRQQGFNPRWGIPDDGAIAITGSAYGADPRNIPNALAIASQRYGEEHDNLPNGAATDKCNAIYAARRRPPVKQQQVGFGGVVCNQVWMMVAAIAHAPALNRTALVAGLRSAGSVDFSYPGGPNDFRAPRTTTGGQFWRPVRLDPGCSCWKVVDPAFRPAVR